MTTETENKICIFAANINESFRNYWKAKNYEITTNWAGKLAIALTMEMAGVKNSIKETAEEAKVCKNNYEQFSQLIMATGYIGSLCYSQSESFKEYGRIFHSLYNELWDIASITFTDDEFSTLYKLLRDYTMFFMQLKR